MEMKCKRISPHEFTERTVKDIERRRKAKEEGKRQAFMHCMENKDKIQRRLGYGRY